MPSEESAVAAFFARPFLAAELAFFIGAGFAGFNAAFAGTFFFFPPISRSVSLYTAQFATDLSRFIFPYYMAKCGHGRARALAGSQRHARASIHAERAPRGNRRTLVRRTRAPEGACDRGLRQKKRSVRVRKFHSERARPSQHAGFPTEDARGTRQPRRTSWLALQNRMSAQ